MTIALKQVNERPAPPSELNAAVTLALEAVVMRALEKHPAQRFENADDFIAALEQAKQTLLAGAPRGCPRPPEVAMPPDGDRPLPQRPASTRRGRPTRSARLVAIVLAAGAIVVRARLLAGGEQRLLPMLAGAGPASAHAHVHPQELADLRAERDAMTAQWEAERNYDLNRAAELRHGRLPELERRLEAEEERLEHRGAPTHPRLLREEVTDDEIAEVVARWTGIPVARLVEGEREKLLRLDDVLRERVIGQDETVQLVADAVIRARAGVKDPKRPIGSFIFLGPTGVGKTELSRALAEALFDSEDNMVRLDMSEYQERHTVSRLMGAPPGYVGYEEGGQLTEAVRRKPYSVVLFDEIEKAHPDVFNTLLQILDDGRLTDAQGRTVNFRNTVIIMTSNIGSLHLLEGLDDRGNIREDVRDRVLGELRTHFRPEFLNRVDETVLFKPLTLQEIERIVDLQIVDLTRRLADRRMTLDLTEAARELIAREGYDPVYGARPLRRFIQREVETKIGRALLAGDISDGATITLDAADDELVVRWRNPGADERAAEALEAVV